MVDNFKAKMLISINTLGRESFTINIGNMKTKIGSCNNNIIPLEVAPRAQTQFIQKILADKDPTIPAKSLG